MKKKDPREERSYRVAIGASLRLRDDKDILSLMSLARSLVQDGAQLQKGKVYTRLVVWAEEEPASLDVPYLLSAIKYAGPILWNIQVVSKANAARDLSERVENYNDIVRTGVGHNEDLYVFASGPALPGNLAGAIELIRSGQLATTVGPLVAVRAEVFTPIPRGMKITEAVKTWRKSIA